MANFFAPLSELTPAQRRAFIAAFLGWTLDAFDFFLTTFVIKSISDEFGVPIPTMFFVIAATLLCRPIGALLFGIIADRYGRRRPLMASIFLFSVFELLSGFAPGFRELLILRALFGIAMGGEWGVGAALALESLPVQARGIASGILQQGYATGYLLAALVYGGLFNFIGWRGMFFIGVLPALLVLFIRSGVNESPVWHAASGREAKLGLDLWRAFTRAPGTFAFAIILMAGFNFMSHGSQDLYPTFLTKQHGFDPSHVRTVTVVMNAGAIFGGTLLGALSQRIGRRVAIAACCLFGAALLPFWSGAPSAGLLALSAFGMQFFVQGAWGVVPAYLNELSPPEVRATFPGLTYQLGNAASAFAANWEAAFALRRFPLPAPQGANYGAAMELIMFGVFATVFLVVLLGKDRRVADF